LSSIPQYHILFYPAYADGVKGLSGHLTQPHWRLNMSLELPDPIARYFAADTHSDAALLAACFTPDATVIDEGNTYAGREAIRQWLANASTQYTYTAEPFALAQHDGRTIVTSRLTGNFPVSPVDLRYIFTLEGDGIVGLEIVL
jgi:hypothetical protein